MKMSKQLFSTVALVASIGSTAGAQVTGSFGGGVGPYLELSAPALCSAMTPCTLGGGFGTIVGGTIYAADNQFADVPGTDTPGLRFLAAGQASTVPSVLTFSGAGIGYISFLWGSPDLYNVLTVTSTGGITQNFTVGPTSLNLPTTNGDQGFSQYVQFQANPGVLITSLTFSNNPLTQDAFEVTNFTTNTVPEPSTYALMAAGLAALGFASKRRKQV